MNLFSILLIAAKRLFYNGMLVACNIFGLVVAVALITCIPLYSDGVNTRLLEEGLQRVADRPPFSLMFWYIGDQYGRVNWTEYRRVNDYLMGDCIATIGLPFKGGIRYVASDMLRLFSTSGIYGKKSVFLGHIRLGFITGLENHIEVIEGRFPRPSHPEDPVGVLVAQAEAEKLGFQVGETYHLFYEETVADSKKTYQVPIVISGIWRPLNFSSFLLDRFYRPRVFLMPEQSFVERLAPLLLNEVGTAVWYLIFDGYNVHPDDVPGLIERIKGVSSQASSLLSDTALRFSPVKTLLEYRRNFFLLSIILYVFSIPLMGLVFYFIVLISQMMVGRQRNEIAVLRSRGTTRGQIFGIYLLEGLLMGAVALFTGIFLGKVFAEFMGNFRSFLSFSYERPLTIKISLISLYFALTGVALALLASLVPCFSASRHSIVTYKQKMARSSERPWWQRYNFDFILVLFSLYGYYMLHQRGTISIIERGKVLVSPFQNPLLFLIPTLFIFALVLVFMRFFPYLMEFLAKWSQRLSGVSMVLVLRQLARSIDSYRGPLILLILTLSLACFTASMARTLDGHLSDRAYYETGADLNLSGIGNWSEEKYSLSRFSEGGQSQLSLEKEEERTKWEFLPVFEYLRIPWVLKATRVGSFSATASMEELEEECHLIGVDPENFEGVAYFRQDFAPHSLDVLMNSLVLNSRALLANRDFLEKSGLKTGDDVLLSVKTWNEEKTMRFVIADVIDFFPTAYPENGPFLVGNLDYLFEQMGDIYPYDLWLIMDENFDRKLLMEGFKDLQGVMPTAEFPQDLIRKGQMQPERQGFFGLLSIGYISVAILTLLGFFLYSFVSFKRRSIELGLLRAIGLSMGQMSSILAGELLLLVGIGIAAGTGLGTLASHLFIPFFQVSSGPYSQTPPFIVQIGWDNIFKVYLVFGIVFGVATVGTIILLVRMRIFQVLKLGESL